MKFKSFIVLIAIFIVSFSFPASANESVWDRGTESYTGALNITVYRSPSCNCCGGWIAHLKKHDFQVKDIKTDEMEVIKQQNNLPQQLASCHTALVDGYVIEGHVPADDIKRLLKQKSNIAGLSVPQMPVGTPGMESGNQKDPFSVIAFSQDGQARLFKEY